jgi:hypothetical protein
VSPGFQNWVCAHIVGRMGARACRLQSGLGNVNSALIPAATLRRR